MLEKSGDVKEVTIDYKGEKKTVFLHAVLPEMGWIVVTNSPNYDPEDIIGFMSQKEGKGCICPPEKPTCVQIPDGCFCM